MKILHVLPTRNSSYGGPVRVAEVMKQGLETLGHEVRIFPSECRNNHEKDFYLYWPGISAIKQLIVDIRWADLVHVHGLWTLPTSIACRIAVLEKTPYIITLHGMLDRWSVSRSKIKKIFYFFLIESKNFLKSNAVHYLNTEEKKEAQEYLGQHSSFILPNGVDVSHYSDLPNKQTLLSTFPEVSESLILLFLGRIHEKKGFDLLIPALAAAIERGVSIHLIIAGPDEGGYQKIVEGMVDSHGIGNSVSFAGEVHGKKKFELLGGSDLFVLSSHQEGDSVAVKEALASGLPVIITRACHLNEVEFLNAGIVCDEDISQLTSAIVLMANNHGLRKVMSVNAHRMIVNHYQIKDINQKLEKIYKDIIYHTKFASG